MSASARRARCRPGRWRPARSCACASSALRMGAASAPAPAATHRWVCRWRHPCRRSCPAWRSRPSRPGCRPPPETPGPAPRRSRQRACLPHPWLATGRAHQHAALQQGTGFKAVHVAQLRLRQRTAHAGQVNRLPARHARRARQPAPAAGTAWPAWGRDIFIARASAAQRPSACSASPASKAWASPNHMHRGLATAQHVVVHAGHVVVHQRIGVDQLDRAGRAQGGLVRCRHGLRRRPAPARGAGACRRPARRSAWPRPARRGIGHHPLRQGLLDLGQRCAAPACQIKGPGTAFTPASTVCSVPSSSTLIWFSTASSRSRQNASKGSAPRW
jgi:hypothetical protein